MEKPRQRRFWEKEFQVKETYSNPKGHSWSWEQLGIPAQGKAIPGSSTHGPSPALTAMAQGRGSLCAAESEQQCQEGPVSLPGNWIGMSEERAGSREHDPDTAPATTAPLGTGATPSETAVSPNPAERAQGAGRDDG